MKYVGSFFNQLDHIREGMQGRGTPVKRNYNTLCLLIEILSLCIKKWQEFKVLNLCHWRRTTFPHLHACGSFLWL